MNNPRSRIILGLIMALVITKLLGWFLFTDNSSTVHTERIVGIITSAQSLLTFNPAASFNSAFQSVQPSYPEPTSAAQETQTYPTNVQERTFVNPTQSFNSPTNPPGSTVTTVPSAHPTTQPSKTPTQIPKASPTVYSDPTFQVTVVDENGNRATFPKLCRAVCKADNCTQSLCVTNASSGTFNRGGPHSGYTGYGIEMDFSGKNVSVLSVNPNYPGRMTDCVTIPGKCYLWDYWFSGPRSLTITVSK